MAFILRNGHRTVLCGTESPLSMEDEIYYRGDDLTVKSVPPRVAIYIRKGIKVPDLFFFIEVNYLCLSEFAKGQIVDLADGQCSFSPIGLHYGRGAWRFQDAHVGDKIDKNYYVMSGIQRLDTIDWGRSEAQAEQTWVYKGHTDEQVRGTHIHWPVKNGLPLGAVYEGLVLQRHLLQGKHIWREHFANWQFASLVFISDEMKQLIEQEKLGSFNFIPVQEV